MTKQPSETTETGTGRRLTEEDHDARETLARSLHLTFAKLESTEPEWEKLTDEERYIYRQCIRELLGRRAEILAALA